MNEITDVLTKSWVITFSCFSLIAVAAGFNMDLITQYLGEIDFPKYWWYIIGLILLCGFLVVALVIFIIKYWFYTIIPHVNDSVKQKHPILVIDDDTSYLKKAIAKIKEQGYDAVVGINNLEDSRLVDAFEIIVSDINGIGSLREAKDLLEAIYKKYPYKIIIPVSSGSFKLDVGEQLIKKVKYEKELSEIIKKINTKIDLINNTKVYWKSVECKCEGWKMDKTDIIKRKKAFIHYLNSLNGGWI